MPPLRSTQDPSTQTTGRRWAVVRSKVIIVQIRTSDVQPGDVINKRGPERSGWMEVDRVETLLEGDLIVHDESGSESFTAKDYDLIWLQTLEELIGNSHLPTPSASSQLL